MEAAAFLFAVNGSETSAKKQRNAPQTRKTDQRIDDSAEYSVLATKDPCYQVKLEDAYQTPIDGADDRKDQCNRIHNITSVRYLGYFYHSQVDL